MCNCKNTIGFKEKLAEAKKLTESTSETHVVYVHKAVNVPFMRKESDLNDALGICCYFLPDGTEKEYVAGKKPSTFKIPGLEKAVEDMGKLRDAASEVANNPLFKRQSDDKPTDADSMDVNDPETVIGEDKPVKERKPRTPNK